MPVRRSADTRRHNGVASLSVLLSPAMAHSQAITGSEHAVSVRQHNPCENSSNSRDSHVMSVLRYGENVMKIPTTLTDVVSASHARKKNGLLATTKSDTGEWKEFPT
jgi:hypothetical protein